MQLAASPRGVRPSSFASQVSACFADSYSFYGSFRPYIEFIIQVPFGKARGKRPFSRNRANSEMEKKGRTGAGAARKAEAPLYAQEKLFYI